MPPWLKSLLFGRMSRWVVGLILGALAALVFTPPRIDSELSPIVHRLGWSLVGGVVFAAFGLALDIVGALRPRP